MGRLAAIILFLAAISGAKGQSTHSVVSGADSTVQAITEINPPGDTALLKKRQELDSIQSSVAGSFDSLKQEYDNITSTADKSINAYQSKIDSLNNLGLPTGKLAAKRDSVVNWKNEKLAPIREKSAALREKTIGKLNSMDLPPELQEHTQQLTSQVDKLDVALPKDQLPSLSLKDPSASPLPNIDNPLGGNDLPSLPGSDVKVPGTDVGNLGDKAKVPGLSEVGEAGDKVKEVSGMVPKNADDMAKQAEQQVTKIDGVNGVEEQLGQGDKLQQDLLKKEDPEALKKETLNKAKSVAVDHFAGKEKQLQEAMQKMAKYKQKYSSVQSLSDLPKKAPNAMRGKPLIERVVPGIAFQVHRRNEEWLVDFNPYAGYRFSGRITGGAGWNYRLSYNKDSRSFPATFRIYGPRVFGEVKAFKGISGRLEAEWMKTFIPPRFPSHQVDYSHREWVFSMMAGIKKEYKFIRNVKGTVFIFYNLYDPDDRSPYGDRLNMRFGFEFPMKKKVKKSEKNDNHKTP